MIEHDIFHILVHESIPLPSSS